MILRRVRARRISLSAVLALALVLADPGLTASGPGFDPDHRPAPADGVLYDFTGLLQRHSAGMRTLLEATRSRDGVEVVVVAVKNTGGATIQTLAARIVSAWGIGRSLGGRGVLILLDEATRTVKVEVSYALEDVFTDRFLSHVQENQLQPYYGAGQLQIGLIAVLEELSQRVSIKMKGGDVSRRIADLDGRLLSGGAGTTKSLRSPRPQGSPPALRQIYGAGATPDEAFRTLLRTYKDAVRDGNQDIYSDVGKLRFRDVGIRPDSFYHDQYAKLTARPYRILSDGRYAVVSFGKTLGGTYSPFLLARTRRGWVLDLVHQAFFVRHGFDESWSVACAEHPYANLAFELPYLDNLDIPFEPSDRYSVDADGQFARELLDAEDRARRQPDDFEALLALARIYTILCDSLRDLDALERARRLRPSDPRLLKYLAIAQTTHFQNVQAIATCRQYVKAVPDSPFAHDLLGFNLAHRGLNHRARDEFESALRLDPNDVYARFWLVRILQRLGFRGAARDLLDRLKRELPADSWRLRYLAREIESWRTIPRW